MSNYTLHEVKTPKDEKIFLDMPCEIYKDDPMWVRPWDHEIKAVFDPAKNHLLHDGEAIRWVVFDSERRPVGRIAAFYSNELASKGYCKAGGCGFFESIDSHEVAGMMFDAAAAWLAERGLQAMDGSVNFGERDQFWGVLVDGFHHPMYGSVYNKPYYGKLFEQYGFQVYFNQYIYKKELDIHSLNPAVIERANRLMENPDFEFRSIRKNEINGLGEKFRTVYNRAWERYPDMTLISSEQALQMEKNLSPIIDPDILFFAFHKGEPIGFFIIIPDLNQAIRYLNGKFGWWSKLKFMYHLKIKKSCDIMLGLVFGVVPEFQGKGVESGMIMALSRYVEKQNNNKYKHLELVWIGDFNPLMMRVAESYVCAQRYKKFITYRYMLDKNVPFQTAPRVSAAKKEAQ